MDKKESVDKICENKIFLLETLSVDANFILQHVQQAKLITLRDYNNLSDFPQRETKIINLLDKLMGKGEETCHQFIALLRQDCVLENFPMLKDHDIFDSSVQEISPYRIIKNPRGICVIINNEIFSSFLRSRTGSDKDREYLAKVFHWLGFEVVEHNNKDTAEMRNILKDLGRTVDGDCFVCCVLTHGVREGVCGTDGNYLSIDEIREPFTGVNCQKLVGKPKLFFIQACRGDNFLQACVKVEADAGNSKAKVEGDNLDITIPSDTDFLIARSTTDGHVSYRNVSEGSWFIQSLCRNLEKHCPRGADILTILLYVNNEVSSQKSIRKQMPIYEVALTRKLFLRPVNP
nr:caspase-8-like [Danio rerio]|eukprot:XP_009300531.1 caspase-8-like [Danio rerio]